VSVKVFDNAGRVNVWPITVILNFACFGEFCGSTCTYLLSFAVLGLGDGQAGEDTSSRLHGF
jgi:hypothetical protein